MTSAKPLELAVRKLSLKGLRDWLSEMVNRILNRMFALRHTVAALRSTTMWLLFWALIVVFLVTSRTSEEWAVIFANFLNAFVGNPLPDGVSVTDAFMAFFNATLLNPGIWAHGIALYAPFWMAHRITAIYLADIFEKDEAVARLFILQAAFASDYNTVRIREGKIVESDQNSPIVQIGGPGYVVVELDSAALFERPDGSAHVVPPTVRERKGRKIIEGFERIRQAADLREIMASQKVTARSRDGIPVIGEDIQYSYSIYRGENPIKTLQIPYPFSEKAVEDLAYKQPRPVKPGVAPHTKPDWHSPLPGKITGPIQNELGGFVSRRGLSEFLASIGAPEEDALRNREDELDQMGQKLSGHNGHASGEIFFKSPASFASRSAITAMFYEQDGFKKRAAGRGFQLNWIGVGTWITPTEIIPAKHLEAWKLSRENASLNNPEQLKRLREEAYLEESLRLVQAIPINKFYAEWKPDNHTKLIDSLIGDYSEYIQSAIELYEREEDQNTPITLHDALQALNQLRGKKYHFINDDGDDDDDEDIPPEDYSLPVG